MRVDDASIKLQVVQRPRQFVANTTPREVTMTSTPFQVDVRATVHADASVPPLSGGPVSRQNPRNARWKLGFMQVQILENAWAYYRGARPSDGCVFDDLSGFRSERICRDYSPLSNTEWYEGSSILEDCYGIPDLTRQPPWNVELIFGDCPRQTLATQTYNRHTSSDNDLFEARFAAAFLTTVTEQVTPGLLKHHRHFFWSVIWHVQALPATRPNSLPQYKTLPGTGFWMSPIHHNAPRDARYLATLNNTSYTQSCNSIASGSSRATSAPTWQRFPRMDERDKRF